MADGKPPTHGTTSAPSADAAFAQALTTLKGDALRRAIERFFTAEIARSAREQLHGIERAAAAVEEYLPPFIRGPLNSVMQEVKQGLVAAVPAAKAVSNGPGDSQPIPKPTGADPVELATGQLLYQHTDLSLDGGGIAFEFVRTYRSRARYPNGPLGVCWDHNYNVWLREVDADTIVVGSGALREDRYKRFSPGAPDDDYFAPVAGQHAILLRNQTTDKFELTSPAGVVWQFVDLGQFDARFAGVYRLERIFDRFQKRDPVSGEPRSPGNYLHFHYDLDQTHLLSSIEVNHATRHVVLEYDDVGRIRLLTDYSGRQVEYTFDDQDDLVTVTLPATHDRRLGRTTFYEYGDASTATPHLLSSVIDADGRRYLEVEYGTAEGFVDHERVVRQRDDTGDWLLSYADLIPAPDPAQPADPDEPASYTVLTHPNGHRVEHWFNAAGVTLFKADSYRDGDGLRRQALWRYQVNPDGATIATLSPEGVFTQHYYARDQYMLLHGAHVADPLDQAPVPTARRRQTFGNLLGTIRRKQPPFPLLQWPTPTVADGIGIIHPGDIVQRFTYDQCQLPASISDPRATTDLDTAQAARLTTWQYSADVHRFPRALTYPATTRPDGSPAPAVQETFNCDTNGRIVDRTDAEGHLTHTDFFQDIDHALPDPTFGLGLIGQPGILSLEGFVRGITVGSGEPDQATTTFTVNRRGARTAITDPRLATTTMRLDTTDQPIEATRALAPGVSYTTRFNYTGQGDVRRQTRAIETDLGAPVALNGVSLGSEVRTFRYGDTEQLLRQRIGGLDNRTWLTTRHAYNADGQPSRHFTPCGLITQIRYDRRMLPTTTIQGWGTPEAVTSRIFYDRDGRKVATRDGRGGVTRFEYDSFGRLSRTIAVTDWPVGTDDARPLAQRQGHTTVRSYDALDNVVLERAFQWNTGNSYLLLSRTSYEFDEHNRKIREIRDLFDAPAAAGGLGLDAFLAGPPASSTQIETWFFLDGNGRVTDLRQGVVSAGPLATPGSSRLSEYDHSGREVRSRIVLLDKAGIEVSRTETMFDGNGNPVRADRWDHDYNAAGLLIGTEVISTAAEFDPLNRRTAGIDGLGNRTSFRYDSRDLLFEQTDPLGNAVSFAHDVYGHRVGIVERPDTASAILTSFTLDADGRTVAITRGDQLNPALVTNRYEFDAINRKIAEILAAGAVPRVTRWSYDAAGNIAGRFLPNGVRLTLQHDAQNRLRRVDVDTTQVAAPNPPVLGALLEKFDYDGLGRLVHAETDQGLTAVDIAFDSLGRPTVEIQSLAGESALAVRRSFDSLGNRAILEYPSGRRIMFTYDLASRTRVLNDLVRGIPNVGLPGAGARLVATMEYVGLRKRLERHGNGASTQHDYDAAGRRIGVDHRDAAGNSLLALLYLSDAAGNICGAWQSGATALHRAKAYRYDGAHRLSSWGDSASPPPNVTMFAPPLAPLAMLSGQALLDAALGAPFGQDRDYRYDAGSNRVAEQVSGSITAVDQLDRLTAVTYDDNGNPYAYAGYTFGFDSHQRLVSGLGNGAAFSAIYDGLGRRVLVTEGAVRSRFVYDGASDIAEYRNEALVTESVVTEPPDGRIQFSTAGEEHVLFRDLVGSIRLASSSTGVITARGEFDPYGLDLASSFALPALRHRFMGREWDESLGLYHFRARHYDPSVGRFQQRDPLASGNGRSDYHAFGANPLVYVDPMGTRETHTGDESNTRMAAAASAARWASSFLAPRGLDGLPGPIRFFSGLRDQAVFTPPQFGRFGSPLVLDSAAPGAPFARTVDEAANIGAIAPGQTLSRGQYIEKFAPPSARLAFRTAVSGAPYSAHIHPKVAPFGESLDFFRGDPSQIVRAPRGAIYSIVERPLLLAGGALRFGLMGMSNAFNLASLLEHHDPGEQAVLVGAAATMLTADIVWAAGWFAARNATYLIAGEGLMQLGGSVATGVALPLLGWTVLKQGGEIARQNDALRRSTVYEGATSWGRVFMNMGGALSAGGY